MIDIKEITSKDMIRFVKDQNTKRIRQVSINFYENANPNDFVSLGLFINDELIGISAGAFSNQFGITVVCESQRNKGYGTLLLSEKIKAFHKRNTHYITLVAEDNLLSRRMCEKCQMKEINRQTFTRQTGPYQAITFIKELQ